MKYISKIRDFKLNEKLNKLYERYGDVADELIEELSDDTIEKYYDDNYVGDIEEIVSMLGNQIWQFVDDDKYVEDWIDNDISYQSIRDLDDEDDLRKFIEDNWTTQKEERVIEIWKNDQGDEENEDKISKIAGTVIEISQISGELAKIYIKKSDEVIKKYKVPESHKILVKEGDVVNIGDILATLKYSDEMLEELSSDDLIDVIEDSGEEDEYVEKTVRNRYDNYSAKDLIGEIYGDINQMKDKEIYDILGNYIDDNKIEEYWKDNEDPEYKKEFVKDSIYRDEGLQKEILKSNPSNVLKLAELFKESHSQIWDEYDFQKLYIKEYVKENKWDDKKGNLKAKALKYLSDNFGLNYQIEEEYRDWMWMVSAGKYNL